MLHLIQVQSCVLHFSLLSLLTFLFKITDVVVSVFEVSIRVLGGLLAGHLLAADPQLRLMRNSTYSGALLQLADDLGRRLLPAFRSATGIPFPTVCFGCLSLLLLVSTLAYLFRFSELSQSFTFTS